MTEYVGASDCKHVGASDREHVGASDGATDPSPLLSLLMKPIVVPAHARNLPGAAVLSVRLADTGPPTRAALSHNLHVRLRAPCACRLVPGCAKVG